MSNQVRMSGLISNMDTESIVKQLMSAQRIKQTKIENKQTKLTWTQDKWKDLNTKIYKLYTDQVSKMRLQGSYSNFKATSTNENAVQVTAGTNAPEGTQKIVVTQLAEAQSITSGKLGTQGKDKDGKDITNSTLMKNILGSSSAAFENKIVKVKNGSNTLSQIAITDNTTLGDFLNACKDAGLNANYDATQDRIFISSRTSGTDNAFSFEFFENPSLNDLRSGSTGVYSLVAQSDNASNDSYLQAYASAKADSTAEKSALNSLTTSIQSQLKNNILKDIADHSGLDKTAPDYKTKLAAEVASKYAAYGPYPGKTEEEVNEYLKNEIATKAKDYKTAYNYATSVGPTYNDSYLGELSLDSTSSNVVSAKNSIVVYNDIFIESQSNSVTVNGLTINAKQVTDTPATQIDKDTPIADLKKLTGVTVTTTKDVQTTYDMVKKFITEYNSILKEMNTLYYATSSKGYDPLTDDQKQSMTDDQIEKWEGKIKDSLLRRDDTLGSIIDVMKSSMSVGVKITTKNNEEKTYNLTSYGITTSTDYTEKGLLHIYGDKEDSTYSDKTDKLKTALENDPDTVIKTLIGVASELQKNMSNKMKSTSLRSALSFYNDKEMAKQQTKYTKDIKAMETKLSNLENSYYKKFSAMETAMAKLQKSTAALSQMMG